MTFRITGLRQEPFEHLYGRPDEALAPLGVKRLRVDQPVGYPDRIELREAQPGETVLLLNHVSQAAETPYRATHAIFVREGARQTFDRIGEVPDVLRRRLLSLRGFDADHMLVDADVVEGRDLEAAVERLFGQQAVSYIHAHNAKQGCYAARIDRA